MDLDPSVNLNTPSAKSQPDWSACLQACQDCAEACRRCLDACKAGANADMMAECMKLDFECAAVCDATVQLLSRAPAANPNDVAAQMAKCADACGACATECESHAKMMEHCGVCAEACRECEAACKDAMAGKAA